METIEPHQPNRLYPISQRFRSCLYQTCRARRKQRQGGTVQRKQVPHGI